MPHRVNRTDWSEEILDEIFRHTSVGFVLLDLHGLILEVNAAFEEMLGYSRDELVGRPIGELIPEGEREVATELTTRLCDEEIQNYETTRPYRTRAGRVLTTRVTASVVRSSDDEPVCAIEFVRDIGAQLDAEKALRESEIRYRRIVEDQNEMIARWLPDGTTIFVNESYCRHFQKSRGRIVGTSVYSLLRADSRAALKRKIASLTPDQPSATDQRRIEFRGGAVRWHEWNDRGFFDPSGRLVEIQSIGRDITEQKEAEDAKLRSESRFRRLFEDLPIAVWEADWTPIVAEIRKDGITSFRDVLDRFGDRAGDVIAGLRHRAEIVEANPSALRFAGVEDFGSFAEWNRQAYPPEALVPLTRAAEPVLFHGARSTTVELPLRKASGEPMYVLLHFARTDTDDETWRFIVSALDLTERRAAEEAVSLSESKFRQLFEDLPIAAWMSDWTEVVAALRERGVDSSEGLRRYMTESPEAFWSMGNRTRILEINPVALRMAGASDVRGFEAWISTGYGRDAVEKIVEVTAPIMFDGAKVATTEIAFGSGGPNPRELRLQWARVDLDDDRFRLIVTAIDVTEMKRAKKALEASESKFRRLFYDLPIAVWMADWSGIAEELASRGLRDGRSLMAHLSERPEEFGGIVSHNNVLEVNPAALTLGGVSGIEEFKGWIQRAFTPEGLRRLINAVSPILFEGRSSASVELPLIRSNGQQLEALTRWVRSDANDQPWVFIVTSVDVTERNRIERDLEHRQHLLEQAESIAQMGSWEWDSETGEVRASVEFATILEGSTTTTSVHDLRSFLERVLPEDRHLVERALRPLAEPAAEGTGRLERPVDFRIVRPDGTIRLVRGQGFMIRNAEGRITGGFGVLRDVTEEKEAEEEAARQREELVRADKMITLGILVSGVAHEINNPNHAIMLNVPVLKGAWNDAAKILDRHESESGSFDLGGLPWGEMKTEIPAVIDDILRGSERIRDIVAELKGFARDQDARLTNCVSLNDVARSARRLMANQIKNAAPNFVLDLADGIPPVLGNASRIEQILVNLILNACDALTDPAQRVCVSTGCDEDRSTVWIRVEDEGRGIESKDLERILDPFFTTRRSSGGTGLGLAVSSRIVEEHGGSITYQSEVGSGTIATIRLPAAPESGLPDAASESVK